MSRRNYPGDSADLPRSHEARNVPSAPRSRSESDRPRRNTADGSASGHGRRRRMYGPPRTRTTRAARDRRYWRHRAPEVAAAAEAEEIEKLSEELENTRIAEDKLESLEVLTVKNLDLHIRDNAFRHHTRKYDCTKGDNAQPVLRRGQEFEATVTFNRTYQKDKDDLFFVVEADEENPGKNLKERFQLDEDKDDKAVYWQDEEWRARIVQADESKMTLKLAVYIPADCVIGEWDLKIKTAIRDKEEEDFFYLYPQPLIILFNPWCAVDQVYLKDQKLLKEYILNDFGTYFWGSEDFVESRPWNYGQFDKGILEICLSVLRKAFGFKMTPNMSDPILVSRALSMIINKADNDGILVGNWSGNYEGGKSPSFWTSSATILRQYEDSGEPVKFGQCWVFSCLLTAVSRALGLPCRSITNFSSGHDTDNTCTLDYYFNEKGEKVRDIDSIWNFHLWNEVWILRPDLPGGVYDGWQVVDSTPQEQSYGFFQCGPCPVKAVKRGEINVGFDTSFVFSEVNGEVVEWVVDSAGEIIQPSAIRKHDIGKKISTKTPDGKAHKKRLSSYRGDDPSLRLDLTEKYKYPEGSPEEREVVKRAVRFSRHGKNLYNQSEDLEVTFDKTTQIMVGQDLVITSYVKNNSKEEKKIDVLMAVRTTTYWNHSIDNKQLVKEEFGQKVLKTGEMATYSITVASALYLKNCDESLSVFAYICARDVKANMPYSAQHPFIMRLPELDEEGPDKAASGEVVTVTVSFTNPLSVPLTGCKFHMGGNLDLAKEDTNAFQSLEPEIHTLDCGDVEPGAKFSLTVRLVGEIEPDEAGRIKTMYLAFACAEIGSGIMGAYVLELSAPK